MQRKCRENEYSHENEEEVGTTMRRIRRYEMEDIIKPATPEEELQGERKSTTVSQKLPKEMNRLPNHKHQRFAKTRILSEKMENADMIMIQKLGVLRNE